MSDGARGGQKRYPPAGRQHRLWRCSEGDDRVHRVPGNTADKNDLQKSLITGLRRMAGQEIALHISV